MLKNHQTKNFLLIEKDKTNKNLPITLLVLIMPALNFSTVFIRISLIKQRAPIRKKRKQIYYFFLFLNLFQIHSMPQPILFWKMVVGASLFN